MLKSLSTSRFYLNLCKNPRLASRFTQIYAPAGPQGQLTWVLLAGSGGDSPSSFRITFSQTERQNYCTQAHSQTKNTIRPTFLHDYKQSQPILCIFFTWITFIYTICTQFYTITNSFTRIVCNFTFNFTIRMLESPSISLSCCSILGILHIFYMNLGHLCAHFSE